MDDNDHRLFDELIAAAGTLVTAAEQASVVLSEEFEGVVRGPIASCRAVLEKCPPPMSVWEGEIREDDLKVETYRSAGQYANEDDLAVKITHMPTGITRMSESKNSQLANREVAMESLRKAVERRMRERS